MKRLPGWVFLISCSVPALGVMQDLHFAGGARERVLRCPELLELMEVYAGEDGSASMVPYGALASVLAPPRVDDEVGQQLPAALSTVFDAFATDPVFGRVRGALEALGPLQPLLCLLWKGNDGISDESNFRAAHLAGNFEFSLAARPAYGAPPCPKKGGPEPLPLSNESVLIADVRDAGLFGGDAARRKWAVELIAAAAEFAVVEALSDWIQACEAGRGSPTARALFEKGYAFRGPRGYRIHVGFFRAIVVSWRIHILQAVDPSVDVSELRARAWGGVTRMGLPVKADDYVRWGWEWGQAIRSVSQR